MPKNNTTDFFDYVVDHFIFELFIICLYNAVVYNLIPGTSYSSSRLLFFIASVGFCILSMLICRKRQRNRMTVCISVLFPVGIYTCLSYFEYLKVLIIIVTIITLLLSGAYVVYAFSRKVRNPDLVFVYKRRFFASARIFFEVATVMFSIVIGTVFFIMTFGDGFAAAKMGTVPTESYDANTALQGKMDTLTNIQKDKWKSISMKERIETLQTIADIEACYLGLPHELNVKLCSSGYATLGYYDDKTHCICLNIIHFNANDPVPMIETVAHECFHAYQKRSVDIFNQLSPEDQKLILFRPASDYQKEFLQYKGMADDFDSYYTQRCESDARNYAQKEVSFYYSNVEQYNNKTGS